MPTTSIVDPRTGSHPAVRFDAHPAVQGELYELKNAASRDSLVDEVVTRTAWDFVKADPRLMLEETLYHERVRLRRANANPILNPYIYSRQKRDKKFIAQVQSKMKGAVGLEEYRTLLRDYSRHFGQEICGRFDPRVYDFAIRAVPWAFNWLLNAASLKRFIPLGFTEGLESRLRVVGEVDHLQKLAQNGTVLLVPTHLSNIDSLLIGYVIHLMSLPPFAYGAGLNLFTNPLLAFSMSRLGAYTVDRQKSHSLYKSALKNYSTSILKQGVHSIFFPGGGRSRTGALENHLKLGLLGTALQAQIERLQENHAKPNLYIVPVVMNYHFVFEASTLIEEYLEQAGKHRFLPNDSAEAPLLSNLVKFFWKMFRSRSEMWVRIGRPLDVFGNFVDQDGKSIGPNGTVIDPRSWLTTAGELKPVPGRDREYTQNLGEKISERFHAENTVLSSHLVAFSLFQGLRRLYPNLDLYRFLRLSEAQRAMPLEPFYQEAERSFRMVKTAADQGRLFLSDPLKCGDVKLWVEDGLRSLGLFHEAKVVKLEEGVVSSEDMNLLYYYRNRLTGYGFGRIKDGFAGEKDEQGFLV